MEAALSSLHRDALLYAVRFSTARCLRLARFKGYGIYHAIMGSEVWVLAVLHGARDVGRIIQRRKSHG